MQPVILIADLVSSTSSYFIDFNLYEAAMTNKAADCEEDDAWKLI